ncbi:MAG: SpoIIE family protein phosphatase [Treponema sp.]|jgi:sigma-B regulation protein RsbU (phosphoserine phosphatase)|nr:SpoIIE family protein phosphatase [Treponema sp.]
MKIRTRILLQTLSASLAFTLVLGTVFLLSVAGIRKTVLANSNELGDSAAEISAKALEVQVTEKIDRIAQDTALLLDERIAKIENRDSLNAVFSHIVDSAEVGRNGQLFILNQDGIKVYSSEGLILGENFLENPGSRLYSLGLSMTLGATGRTELEIDGLPVYAAYAPIRALGWSLGVAVSAREVSASALLIENQIWRITDNTRDGIDRYILLLAGVVAFLLVLTLLGISFFAFRFTRAVTGPILALNSGVQEVAGGNLEREVIVKTGDEIEQLAESFNMMTSQLRKHIEEIARVTAERQRINTELDIATQIQMSMLPNSFPPFRGRNNEFDLYAQVDPARAVGGDFYDFFFIDDDHFAMIVADVSGKGVPAALFMAITKTVIKNRLQSREDPALSLEIINRQLCDNNIMDMFVTAWLCILEISSHRLVYVNAGHNPPLLKSGKENFSFLVSPPDLVLAGMDDTRYHSREAQLKGGDMLFLYTDGIVEATNTGIAFYGKKRLNEFLDANAAQPLPELIRLLRADIAAFAGGAEQSDDITMLAIRLYEADAIPPLRSITLKADIKELDALNAFVGRGLDSVGCPRQIWNQIELACEEVFANIVQYADANEAVIDCRLESSPNRATMTLVFCDRGRSFNPLEHSDPDITLPLEERKPGGLGLLIVKKTMDTMQYSREKGMNRLEFSKSWQKE